MLQSHGGGTHHKMHNCGPLLFSTHFYISKYIDTIKNNFLETCVCAIQKQSSMHVWYEKYSLIIMVGVKITCNNFMLSLNLGLGSLVLPTQLEKSC